MSQGDEPLKPRAKTTQPGMDDETTMPAPMREGVVDHTPPVGLMVDGQAWPQASDVDKIVSVLSDICTTMEANTGGREQKTERVEPPSEYRRQQHAKNVAAGLVPGRGTTGLTAKPAVASPAQGHTRELATEMSERIHQLERELQVKTSQIQHLEVEHQRESRLLREHTAQLERRLLDLEARSQTAAGFTSPAFASPMSGGMPVTSATVRTMAQSQGDQGSPRRLRQLAFGGVALGILLGLGMAVLGSWPVAEARVDARITELTAPISGMVKPPPGQAGDQIEGLPRPGAKLEAGQLLCLLRNEAVDTSMLDQKRVEAGDLRRRLDGQAAQQQRLITERLAIVPVVARWRERVITEVTAQVAVARSATASDPARLALLEVRLERMRAGAVDLPDAPPEIARLAEIDRSLAQADEQRTAWQADLDRVLTAAAAEERRVNALRQGRLSAVTAGVVWQTKADASEPVERGDVLYRVAQTGTWMVQMPLEGSLAGQVEPGDQVLIRLRQLDQTIEGTVIEILTETPIGTAVTWPDLPNGTAIARISLPSAHQRPSLLNTPADVLVMGRRPGAIKRFLAEWAAALRL